ncbi:F-box protein: endocytic membrane traffic, recycling ReCYcling 1 [Elasticomyces elasticus]|nr:F-box protein: endocytic membrane traffic, recycling ReCYcling 1 [Elasticomyces elasticus]KAK4969943.1 F-box protein: endocytic membrane traffic, recycling ReCYcling 1 [Elasticomyces elasticus]
MNGRVTPKTSASTRNSRTMSPAIRKPQLPSALRDVTISSTSKPFLPAELLAVILDYLPVPELMRFARVSRRLQEMVYDDTRWVQKLRLMSAWDEVEARRRFEEALRRKAEAQRGKEAEGGSGVGGRRHAGSVTIFDAGVEEERFRRSIDQKPSSLKRTGTVEDGFEDLSITSPLSPSGPGAKPWDPQTALTIFRALRSIRGRARHEFAKLYGALAPLYSDLARSTNHSEALIFRTYRDPEQQAQILANLSRFALCDSLSSANQSRQQRLTSTMAIFHSAVLREFEHAYTANNVENMTRYASVLHTLHPTGTAAQDAFINMHPIIRHDTRVGNPLDCLDSVAQGHVDLSPSQRFFETLASTMVEQAGIIDQVFPPGVDVLTPFLERLCGGVVEGWLTALFDEAHSARGAETYCKAVSGTYGQSLRFVASLKPTAAAKEVHKDFFAWAQQLITRTCYEKHVDLYLAEESALFKTRSAEIVSDWEKQQNEQEASTESFFMSGVDRKAAKRDFLSSFRKVVMMPVSVLPAFPLGSPFGNAKPPAVTGGSSMAAALESSAPSRSRTPTLTGSPGTPARPGTPVGTVEAPTTELAAKAAIMNSRLEGIKSLFSIEVALNLTHLAKTSIERAAGMVKMGGRQGQAAKEGCEGVFVELLKVLGERHVRGGFDKAVGHLSSYKPREMRKDGDGSGGVEPLVTFLELVNVGDLIQQMIEVFYVQELAGTGLVDRDDFLDPAVKEKKRFEQMLDERVAAGLNMGIDVLMEEVEFVMARTQLATDFNPGVGDEKGGKGGGNGVMDIGPSTTAQRVVELLAGHTGMLTGSTDKNMLDVFTQEVGLRLFGVVCKHIKRQRVSVDGAIKLISDVNHYSSFITSLRQKPLLPYFQALRELGQIYLVHIEPPANSYFTANAKGKRASLFGAGGLVGIGGGTSTTARQAKELASIVADSGRYCGVLTAEEVYEFAERRADWFAVRADVERGMYGQGCVIM